MTSTTFELSNFKAYAVVDEEAKVIAVTDTFSSAIEAAEAHATNLIRDEDDSTAEMAVLAADTEGKPTTQGYYGRWVKYDEKEGEAALQVFFLRVKPDGIVFAGSIQERPLQMIRVQETTVDLFDGFLVSYDNEEEEVVSEMLSTSDDEGSDDETYVNHDD